MKGNKEKIAYEKATEKYLNRGTFYSGGLANS